jgi:hypothetical protein
MTRIRFHRATLVLFFCLVSTSAASFQGAKLSGDLFVTMESGDVKRGADVEVVVLPASSEFTAEWDAVQNGYQREVAPIVNEYDPLMAEASASGTSYPRAKELFKQVKQIADTRWLPLQRQYTQAAFEVISKYAQAKTRTDVNGHFEIEGLQPGKYFVYSRHTVFKNVMYWMVPVNLDSESKKVSLSNSNGRRHSPLHGRTYTAF